MSVSCLSSCLPVPSVVIKAQSYCNLTWRSIQLSALEKDHTEWWNQPCRKRWLALFPWGRASPGYRTCQHFSPCSLSRLLAHKASLFANGATSGDSLGDVGRQNEQIIKKEIQEKWQEERCILKDHLKKKAVLHVCFFPCLFLRQSLSCSPI